MTSDPGQFYDDLSEVYELVWGERLHHGLWLDGGESVGEALNQMEALVLGRCGSLKDQEIVDIGCGNGVLAERMANEGGKVTGITISHRQWEAGRSRESKAGLRIVEGDWLDSGLPDACFDLAISVECVSHVEDRQRFFDEIYRTLKPGGRAVLTCYQKFDRTPEWIHRCLVTPTCRAGAITRLGSSEEYAQWAHHAGFLIEEELDLSAEVTSTWERMLGRCLRAALNPAHWKAILRWPVLRQAWCIPAMILLYQAGWIGYGLFVLKRPLNPRT